MITAALPGMDVSGCQTWGQLSCCPLQGAMKSCLDWLLPRERLASVHILRSASGWLSARWETQSPSFYENFDPPTFVPHHFLCVLQLNRLRLDKQCGILRICLQSGVISGNNKCKMLFLDLLTEKSAIHYKSFKTFNGLGPAAP